MGSWPLVPVELDMGSGGKAATFQGMGIMVAFLARRSNSGLANAGVGLIHTEYDNEKDELHERCIETEGHWKPPWPGERPVTTQQECQSRTDDHCTLKLGFKSFLSNPRLGSIIDLEVVRCKENDCQ